MPIKFEIYRAGQILTAFKAGRSIEEQFMWLIVARNPPPSQMAAAPAGS